MFKAALYFMIVIWMSCTCARALDMERLKELKVYVDPQGQSWPLVTAIDLYDAPITIGQTCFAFGLNFANLFKRATRVFVKMDNLLERRRKLIIEYIDLVLMPDNAEIRALNEDPRPDGCYKWNLIKLKMKIRKEYLEKYMVHD